MRIGPVGEDGEPTIVDFYDFVYRLASPSISPRAMVSVEAQMWSIEVFETMYGTNDHSDASRPMSITEHSPSDDPCYYNDQLAERLKEYVNLDILKYTGLSFDEFINRPRCEVITIMETVAAIINSNKVTPPPDLDK